MTKARKIHKTTAQEKELIFLAASHILEKFHVDTLKERIEEGRWKEISVFVDLFKECITPESDKEKQKMGTYVCTVPNHRVFWDIILGLYVLLRPEVYGDTRQVYQILMNGLYFVCSERKLDWSGFYNFDAETCGYLTAVANGTPGFTSWFDRPFAALVEAHRFIKDNIIEKTPNLTTEDKETMENNFLELESGLLEREDQFQNHTLTAHKEPSRSEELIKTEEQ